MIRRPAAALAAVLLLTTVAACGSEAKDKSDAATGSLKSVSFTGDVGKSLKADFKTKVTAPKKAKVTTLVEGKGDEIKTGDTVSTYLWVGNGTAKKEAFSDYANGKPESIPYTSQLSPVFANLIKGATYGSRVVTVTAASELFGAQGNSQLGIGATDTIVIVADLVEKAAVSPDPTDDKVHDVAPSKQPKVVLKNGKPSGLDFTGIDKPALTTPVQRAVLKKGTGAAVKATDTVVVNYLGATYQAKAPFDESYTKQPLTSELSGLVKGWSIGLTGVKVGSRVLLQMPPAFGYGAEGSGEAIPGNATLWFVIDVVSAK